ncbi:MAG: hypothetical protein ABSH06_26715 [Thermodesulfobacteriota bacterium]
MERIEIRSITANGEARLQQNKRDLEKEGYREVPRKDEKDLKFGEYFVNGFTITYKVRIPEKNGKPL